MNDYSEYLKKPGMLEFIENSWTTECSDIHDSYARVVNDAIKKYGIKSIIEIGCGTGEVARRIKGKVKYTGVDSNADCIMLAKSKSLKKFFVDDIRTLDRDQHDLVCAFSILKHFGLHEWDAIFKKICSFGKYVIFNMPIAGHTHDDGTEFHHVWMQLDELYAAMYSNKLELIRYIEHNPVEPIFICAK